MDSDLIRFKNIGNYLISQGWNMSRIVKESKLPWVTVNNIMKDKVHNNMRPSTLGLIQDFIKKHLHASDPIEEIAKEIETPEPETMHEDIKCYNFYSQMREFVKSVPKDIEVTITIKKK